MKPNHRCIINPLPPSSIPTSTQRQQFNFSDFDRINKIGSGFRGAVYKVLHRPTATHFALKEIYGDHDDDVLCQILREINILHGVNNLNIVTCHNHMFDRDGENIHVLLEYMDGGSLEGTHVSDESTLAELTRQILSGLYYLHNRNIEHRHIKPSSLFISSTKKQVKIGVLGVSRILGQTTHPCNYSVSTIAYMSPERINTDLNKGKYEGCAGDIWSVGVSVLELYMGVLPFEMGREDDWGRLMWTICMSPPPKAPATASREFRDFVGCCLHKDPRKRWTAAQLLCHPFITGAASPS